MKRPIAWICGLLGSAFVAMLAVPMAAQAPAPAPAQAPTINMRDISGFWMLGPASRKISAASLAPGVTRAMIEARAKRDAYAVRWCNPIGTPAIMDSGRPLGIRQGTTAIIMTSEEHSPPRYVYLNRTTHISADIFDPATHGDSIGRWEGDTLVVDTIGFHGDRGILTIPGGGFKTANSHLVERFKLLQNGNILQVISTWTDPRVFRTPHTYEYRYYRMPRFYEPTTIGCDPYDAERAAFLGDPVKPAAAPAAPPGRGGAVAPPATGR